MPWEGRRERDDPGQHMEKIVKDAIFKGRPASATYVCMFNSCSSNTYRVVKHACIPHLKHANPSQHSNAACSKLDTL
jgi:hypothetical protein